MEDFCWSPSRVGAFRAFIATMALEWKNRLDGCETDARAVQRRRTQCHWLLDRTSLSAAVHILAEHRNVPELMLFLLVALTYGLPSWRNLLLAGGLEYLKEICMSFDAAEIRTKWHGTAFVKKHTTHKRVWVHWCWPIPGWTVWWDFYSNGRYFLGKKFGVSFTPRVRTTVTGRIP